MLSKTMNQSYCDSSTVEPLRQADVNTLYLGWQAIDGKDKLPQAPKVPTNEPFGAYKYALAHNDASAEFSIFGPHGTRLHRRMRIVGVHCQPSRPEYSD